MREVFDNMARRYEECLVLRGRKLHLVRDYFELYNNRKFNVTTRLKFSAQVLLVTTCSFREIC